MRVLHVIAGLNPKKGGPTEALCGISRAQISVTAKVSVVTTWSTEIEVLVAERLRAQGIQVQLIGPELGLLRSHPDLAQATRELVSQADVVHIHGLWEDLQHHAALAARRAGVPYLVRPCGMLDPWCLSHHRFRKQAYLWWRLRRDLNGAAALHYTSVAECEGAIRLGLRAPVVIEPLGLDLRDFKAPPDAAELHHRFPQFARRPYVLFFGRLCRKKGVDLLMRAFARAHLSDCLLVISGPDAENYRSELDALAAQLKIRDRVIFTGMLSGAQRLAVLAGARLFALPSRQENFGMAVAEAMASGCPVLVSEHVALQRDVTKTQAGEAFPLKESAWAAGLKAWATDAARCREAGRRGRAFAFHSFDWEQIAAGWLDQYQCLARCPVPVRSIEFSSPLLHDTTVAG